MKILKSILVIGLFFIALGANAQEDHNKKEHKTKEMHKDDMHKTTINKKDKEIMADAEEAKTKILATDSGIQKFFDTASGYAIFPNVGKGGLIVGGASGNGVLYENGKAVGMTSLKKVNIGLQAGGQAVIQVVFFETDDALATFKNGNYEFSAEASAVIADKGKSKNTNYEDGVLVFALPKAGLMADASVGGQKFEYHPF